MANLRRQEAQGKPVASPEQPAVDKLCLDSLMSILSTLDAFSLGMVLGVCKLWREVAASEDLWTHLCRARWSRASAALDALAPMATMC